MTCGNLVIERGQLKGAVDGFELDTCKDGARRSSRLRRRREPRNRFLLSWVPSFHDVLGNILAGHVRIVFLMREVSYHHDGYRKRNKIVVVISPVDSVDNCANPCVYMG